ncbi:hypothetical protein Trisim1_002496 [Trichoderma cf. simile WF8]
MEMTWIAEVHDGVVAALHLSETGEEDEGEDEDEDTDEDKDEDGEVQSMVSDSPHLSSRGLRVYRSQGTQPTARRCCIWAA